MAMLHLHSRLNPQRMVLQNSEEIASVEFYFDGSLITSKGGSTMQVAEKPEDIDKLMEVQ
jgi:hypothetical protein